MNHKKNIFAIAAGLLLGLGLLMMGCWQLDLQVAPRIDWSRIATIPREIMPGWYMSDADAYVMFFSAILIGAFLSIVITFVSLWFWED